MTVYQVPASQIVRQYSLEEDNDVLYDDDDDIGFIIEHKRRTSRTKYCCKKLVMCFIIHIINISYIYYNLITLLTVILPSISTHYLTTNMVELIRTEIFVSSLGYYLPTWAIVGLCGFRIIWCFYNIRLSFS